MRAFCKVLNSVPLFEALWIVVCQAPLPLEFSRKNTGVRCHLLLQGIFPAQESSPCLLSLLHWQVDSLPLHYLGRHSGYGAPTVKLPCSSLDCRYKRDHGKDISSSPTSSTLAEVSLPILTSLSLSLPLSEVWHPLTGNGILGGKRVFLSN